MDKHLLLLLFAGGYIVGGFFLRSKSWVGLLMIVLGMMMLVYSGLEITRAELTSHRFKIEPKAEETRLRMTNLQQALKRFRRDTGSFPTSEQGLRALFVSTGSHLWKGPYLEDARLTDAWDMPIVYRADAKGYLLRSSGEDRRLDSNDDIELRP